MLIRITVIANMLKYVLWFRLKVYKVYKNMPNDRLKFEKKLN